MNKTESEQKKIGFEQKYREKLFCNSLRKDLALIATKAKQVKRPKKKEEFDMLAYSSEENALLVIQVKLSNTSPFTERRKAEWIKKHVEHKAVWQIKQDLEFLDSPDGLTYVSKKLGLKNLPPDGMKIYPLIVTDNFYADHRSYKIARGLPKVNVVSYFELKNLILQRQVDERQTIWKIDKRKPISTIISSVERNEFWKFMTPLIDRISGIKSLSADEPYRINLKI